MSSLLVANREYRQILAESLADIHEFGLLSDITIVCGNQTFKAHKVILVCSSGYFYSIFTKKLKNDIRQLAITDISPEILRMILDFIYTGVLNTHSSVRVKVEAIQRALHFLDMTDVFRHRLNLMMKSLAPDYYAELWSMANKYQIKDMSRQISKFVASRLDACMENSHFILLTLQQLISILSNEFVKQIPESVILQAIQQWVLHDVATRDRYVTSLLSVAKISATARAKAVQFFDGEFHNAQISTNKKKNASVMKETNVKSKATTNTPNRFNSLRAGSSDVAGNLKKKNDDEVKDDKESNCNSDCVEANPSADVQTDALKIDQEKLEEASNEETFVTCLEKPDSSVFVTCASGSSIITKNVEHATEAIGRLRTMVLSKSDDLIAISDKKSPKSAASAQVEQDKCRLLLSNAIGKSYEHEKMQMVNLKNKLNDIISRIRGTLTSSNCGSSLLSPSSKRKSPFFKNNDEINQNQPEDIDINLASNDITECSIPSTSLEFNENSDKVDSSDETCDIVLKSAEGVHNLLTNSSNIFASGDYQEQFSGTVKPLSLSLPHNQFTEIYDFNNTSSSSLIRNNKLSEDDDQTLKLFTDVDDNDQDNSKLAYLSSSSPILQRPIATNDTSLISPEEVKSRLEKFKKLMHAKNSNQVDIENINLKGSRSFIISSSTDSEPCDAPSIEKSDILSDSSDCGSTVSDFQAESPPDWFRTLSTIPEETTVSDFVATSRTDTEDKSIEKYREKEDGINSVVNQMPEFDEENSQKQAHQETASENSWIKIVADTEEIISDKKFEENDESGFVKTPSMKIIEEYEKNLDEKTKLWSGRWSSIIQDTNQTKNAINEDNLKKWWKPITNQASSTAEYSEDIDANIIDGPNSLLSLTESSSKVSLNKQEESEFQFFNDNATYTKKDNSTFEFGGYQCFTESVTSDNQQNIDNSVNITLQNLVHESEEQNIAPVSSETWKMCKEKLKAKYIKIVEDAEEIDENRKQKIENKFHLNFPQSYKKVRLYHKNNFSASTSQLPNDEQIPVKSQLSEDLGSKNQTTNSFCHSKNQLASDIPITKSKEQKLLSDLSRTKYQLLSDFCKSNSLSNESFKPKSPPLLHSLPIPKCHVVNEIANLKCLTPDKNTSCRSTTKASNTDSKSFQSMLTSRTQVINKMEKDKSITSTSICSSSVDLDSCSEKSLKSEEDSYSTMDADLGPIILLLTTDIKGVASQQMYSLKQHCWLPPRKLLMPPLEYNYAVMYLKEHIYYIGGLSDGCFKKMHDVYVYKLRDHILMQAASLQVARVGPGVAHIYGDIFVAGGIGRYHKPLSQVERYNVTSNRWQLVAALHVPRNNPCLVACGKLLFAIGGTVLADSVMEVVSKACECYDVMIDQWSLLVGLPSHFDSYNPLVAVVDSKLFAVRLFKPETVFRFHNSKNKWLPIQHTNLGISKICCLLGGERKLFAIELAGRTIHTFDMHAFQWEVETHIPKDINWQAYAFVITNDNKV